MSKDCKECYFCNGYDYSDGMPRCSYVDKATGDSGYDYCPFNDESKVSKNGITIEIDSGFMSEYIKHTLVNTINNETYKIASDEIKNLITEDIRKSIDKKVKEEMDAQISQMVSEALQNFMDGTMEIGSGWYGDSRTVVRKQYLTEQIEEKLSGINTAKIKDIAQNAASSEIDNFTRKLRNDINTNIKALFDAATRKTLTDGVVTMLMDNDTYKKLANSMASLLPNN
jgi:hypothetical protein